MQTDIPIPLLFETLFSRPLFTGLRNEPTLSPGEPSSKTCLLSISTLPCCPRPRNISSIRMYAVCRAETGKMTIERIQNLPSKIECSFAGWLISIKFAWSPIEERRKGKWKIFDGGIKQTISTDISNERNRSTRLHYSDQASYPPVFRWSRPKLLTKETLSTPFLLLSSPPVLTIPHVLSKLSQLLSARLPLPSLTLYPPSLLKTFSNYPRIRRVQSLYSSSAEVKLRKFDREAGNNFARFEGGILNRGRWAVLRTWQLSTSYGYRSLVMVESLIMKVTNIQVDFCSIRAIIQFHLLKSEWEEENLYFPQIDPSSNFPIVQISSSFLDS